MKEGWYACGRGAMGSQSIVNLVTGQAREREVDQDGACASSRVTVR